MLTPNGTNKDGPVSNLPLKTRLFKKRAVLATTTNGLLDCDLDFFSSSILVFLGLVFFFFKD